MAKKLTFEEIKNILIEALQLKDKLMYRMSNENKREFTKKLSVLERQLNIKFSYDSSTSLTRSNFYNIFNDTVDVNFCELSILYNECVKTSIYLSYIYFKEYQFDIVPSLREEAFNKMVDHSGCILVLFDKIKFKEEEYKKMYDLHAMFLFSQFKNNIERFYGYCVTFNKYLPQNTLEFFIEKLLKYETDRKKAIINDILKFDTLKLSDNFKDKLISLSIMNKLKA